MSLRTGLGLRIIMTPENQGTVTFHTDDIETAADLVQDLAEFLDIHSLDSTANFPIAIEKLTSLLVTVEGFNSVRMKLTVEMAESSQAVKTVLIRAEDARLLGHMTSMRKYYKDLQELNRIKSFFLG